MVVRDHGRHLGRRRDGHPLGFFRGNEDTDGAVVALEILSGHGLHGLRRDLLDAVAEEEVEPPIALRGPLAERDADLGGVGGGHFALFENRGLGAVDFLGGDALGGGFLDGGNEQVADFIQRTAGRDLGAAAEQTRIVLAARERAGGGGFLGLDERLVKPPRGPRVEDARQHLQRGRVLVRAGGNVIDHAHCGEVADAAQRHEPFAVLGRFFGPSRVQLAGRAREDAEVLLDHGQGFRLL